MRDVLPTLEQWTTEGHKFATATVTKTWGSSPRPIGAIMGIRDDGLIIGSVSGGCVETTVIEEAQKALQTGLPKELKFEAIGEDSLWDVGLSCGGQIQIWIEPDPQFRSPEIWQQVVQNIKTEQPCIVITKMSDSTTIIWKPGQEDIYGGILQSALANRESQEVMVEGDRLFLNVLSTREKVVIIGSVHIAVPLVKFVKELGFETVIIDPRSAFANTDRFPVCPDQILCEWPDSGLSKLNLNADTYAVVLTHDPKIDDVALAILLKSPVAYIGALGSRVTQAKRRDTLREQGFTDHDLQRIHGPVGLNIGARSPEEIALSIAAEIVQVRRSEH